MTMSGAYLSATSTGQDYPVIGILSPLVVGGYISEVVSGVTAAAAAVGARVVAIQTLDLSAEGPVPVVSSSTAWVGASRDYVGWPSGTESMVPRYGLRAAWDRIAGFVVVLNAVEPWYLRALRDAGKKVVIVTDEPEGFECPVVRTDNRTGVMAAVSHLVRHGHRRIAFAGSLAQLDVRERLDAYREALSANGIVPDDDLLFGTVGNLEWGGEVAGQSMLAAGMPSTAVVAATDYNALGIMKVLRAAGLELPRDQAIVGYDDVEAAATLHPALSTVRQSVEEGARLAGNLLIAMLAGESVASGRHLVPASFVVRESCGCVVGDSLEDAAPLRHLAPRERLRARLGRRMADGHAVPAECEAALDKAVDVISRHVEVSGIDPRGNPGMEAARLLYSVCSREAVVPMAVECLGRYGSDLEAVPAVGAILPRLAALTRDVATELRRFLADTEVGARVVLQRAIALEHQLSMTLLSGGAGDPTSLGWLDFTTARAGCLGLWSSERVPGSTDVPTLSIAGSYLRHGGPLSLPAQTRVESFPPDGLMEALSWEAGEIVVLLPVKTRDSDFGLLALLTPKEGPDVVGHDRLLEQSALLSVAIERQVMTERLRRSNDDLATFSRAMAHDLRNPIATISMWASAFQSRAGKGGDEAEQLRMVGQIAEVAKFSNELITDLLSYSALDRGDVAAEPMDLNVVAAQALVSIESAVTEQRATVMIGDLPTVSGRPAQLELLLQNLVENAVKYRGSRPPKVRIDSRRDGAGWKISCRDNGCGMPSDVQEKVFEPFVRAGDGSLPGSGLGLATCRRIVEGHGGRIWVESSGAGGTTVSFTLPAAGDSEELVVPLVTDPVLAAARRTLGHRGRRTPGRGAQSALRGAVRRHGEPTPSGKTSVG